MYMNILNTPVGTGNSNERIVHDQGGSHGLAVLGGLAPLRSGAHGARDQSICQVGRVVNWLCGKSQFSLV